MEGFHMSVVLFLNLKGGVAKTTTAVAVAETLAETKHRVLVIDTDHQCAAGELLLGEERLLRAERRRRTLHDLLAAMMRDDFTADQFDRYVEWGGSNVGGGFPHLGVLPCSLRIDDFSTNRARALEGYRSTEDFYAALRQREGMLRRWLTNTFDYVLVDCPPTIPLQVKTLLKVADAYIVPSVPDRLSVRGSFHLMERMRRMNMTRVRPLGLLWTLYRESNTIHRRVVSKSQQGEALHKLLPAPFRTILPNATAIARASEEEGTRPQSVSGKYGSQFAQLFSNLVDEMQGRLWVQEEMTKKEAQPKPIKRI
jgi:chromosome partitioning protein